MADYWKLNPNEPVWAQLIGKLLGVLLALVVIGLVGGIVTGVWGLTHTLIMRLLPC